MTLLARSISALCVLGGVAAAEPTVTVAPAKVHTGDPVLVTFTGATDAPRGKAGGAELQFFPAKAGFQAVVAIPLSVNEDHILVEFTAGPKPLSIPIVVRTFPETNVTVEEDYADPPKADRATIDADNTAIGASYAKATGAPQFAHGFHRPPGTVTSMFGEWRTFNDGHRAQHLGLDLAAREGSPVAAINDGVVALVRDTFLAGTVVVIAHGGGISSLYFHLSKASVVEGDKVAQGSKIGLAGHTGRTTGPHVHLSIHVPGGMVDPATFIKLPIYARVKLAAKTGGHVLPSASTSSAMNTASGPPR
jgi:murein DD-endopeptidase MepM/ murein hydrolase activator NlpD